MQVTTGSAKSEVLAREFKQLCIESRIARHFTVARTPQQNGLAELSWIRSPSTTIDKMTPMKMCSGHPNDYEILYRLDNESPKIVTSRNVVFNESVMYKDILKDSGASTDKSVEELQVEVELQSDGNDKVIMWYQDPRIGLEFCLVDSKIILEPGDANREITVTETFHLQTDDELYDKELKQIEADDQAIQTILLGLPKDIYAVVDSCETAQEIWLRVQQMMKGSDIGIQEKKAKLFNEWERQIQIVGGNGGNQFRQYAGQNAGNPTGYNDVIGNQNQIGNGNLVAARAEGNVAGQNGNQIRCYNYLDEIEEVNANCILMANLQQASTSGTQTDSAPVYDIDGSAEVHENYDDNEIFNMFTQEEQYTELLEPIPESHQVPQTDNNVISEDTSVEQSGETVEQHPVNFEETRYLYESLYQNLAIEVEKVNSVNRKLKETNADLTTELARFKNQERCFEISQEKYDKLE
nr:hypothetical protein [Tanacetum cinerariifolium]